MIVYKNIHCRWSAIQKCAKIRNLEWKQAWKRELIIPPLMHIGTGLNNQPFQKPILLGISRRALVNGHNHCHAFDSRFYFLHARELYSRLFEGRIMENKNGTGRTILNLGIYCFPPLIIWCRRSPPELDSQSPPFWGLLNPLSQRKCLDCLEALLQNP